MPEPRAAAIPRPSQSSPEGAIILPRKLSFGIAAGAVSIVFAAGAWAASLDGRVAGLESKSDTATTDRKEADARLGRIERTLCVLCRAQLGGDACSASCGL